jgi:gas vesicle protein
MSEKRETTAVNKSPTSEDVWAYLHETGRLMRESAAASEKLIADGGKEIRESSAATGKLIADLGKEMRESAAETQKLMRESATTADKQLTETKELIKKMSKKVNEVSEQVGGIKNSIGKLVEGLMTSDLFEKFSVLGFDFDDAISNCTIREKGTKRMLAEVDMLMLNGTIALAIEVKTTMTIGDVDEHLKQMKILHDNPNNLLRGRTLYGAMAGAKMNERTKNHAIKRGLFVLQPSGNTVTIIRAEKIAVW